MDDTELVDRATATRRVLELRDGLGVGATERTAIAEAGGRVLAEPVVSPAAVPAADMATMDGYAFAAGDDHPLTVVDAVFPQDDPPSIGPGEAVEIATGAPLPDRADTVLMREAATVTDGRLSGPDRPPGTNVYAAGATAAAGEELLAADERLAPRHMALLRDVGVDTVVVRRPLEVGILPTGTEIHEGRQPDRDSEMLHSLVVRWGHRPAILASVPDDGDAVREGIRAALEANDIVLTTGGTSVGRADHVVRVLRDHDVRFRGVRLRPGRPLTVAVVEGTPVCALPGKPVAAHTAATLVLRALFTGEQLLPTVAAEFAETVSVPDPDMEYAVPVALDAGHARAYGQVGSPLELYETEFAPGRIASSARVTLADGILLTREQVHAGDRVEVIPYGAIE